MTEPKAVSPGLSPAAAVAAVFRQVGLKPEKSGRILIAMPDKIGLSGELWDSEAIEAEKALVSWANGLAGQLAPFTLDYAQFVFRPKIGATARCARTDHGAMLQQLKRTLADAVLASETALAERSGETLRLRLHYATELTLQIYGAGDRDERPAPGPVLALLQQGWLDRVHKLDVRLALPAPSAHDILAHSSSGQKATARPDK